MEYIETFKRDGIRLRKVYKQKLKELDNTKKGEVRKKINEKVFDIEDSVADNAKMIFLLTSMLLRIYDALPDDIKSNFSPEDRYVIEYALNKYVNTKTRLDLQFQQEGTKVIDKLLDRQKEIANIIQEVYNE